MRTLILYATKYGAAAEIARRIADLIDGAVVHDLKQGGTPAPSGFDCIIVGSSIYAGSIRKEAKAFLSENADLLREKPLGLFLSGMDASQEKEFFDANIPGDILQTAKAASLLGGVYDPQKAGFMERFIYKAATKQSEYKSTIDDVKIGQFVEAIAQG